ncbi:MAG TPA: hypothetical protein VM434_11570 [Beijerinckiaceae bacterium]|nr:hypothetical protein [Beijerinckiaceae bacterium]
MRRYFRRIVPDERARQGPRGFPVLMVLIGSFALLGLYLVGMVVWSFWSAPVGAPHRDTPTAAIDQRNPTHRIEPANPAYPVPVDPSQTGTPR